MTDASWPSTTLGSVAHIEMGQSPPSEYVSDRDGVGLPFLQGNAEFSDDHPVPLLWCRKPGKTAAPGDALISVRAPVGALNRADQAYCIGRGLAAIRFKQLDPRFGHHALAMRARALQRVAQGSTFDAVGSVELRSLSLPAPCPDDQRRIAEILDTLDEQIRTTAQIIAKLRCINDGLLHALLTRGIDENGDLRDPEHKPEQFKNSPLGCVPKDWVVSPGREVCRRIEVGIVIRPAQYYVPRGVPMLRSANVREDGIDMNDLVFMSEKAHAMMAKSAVGPGDLVTVRTGYPGTTAVVPEWLRTANCIDIIISRPSEAIRSDFLAIWINSERGKGQVLRAQGGLAQQHFNVSEMKRLLAPVPTLIEQERISAVLAASRERIRSERVLAEKLTRLRHGLGEDLLLGRVGAKEVAQGDEA